MQTELRKVPADETLYKFVNSAHQPFLKQLESNSVELTLLRSRINETVKRNPNAIEIAILKKRYDGILISQILVIGLGLFLKPTKVKKRKRFFGWL